MSRMSRRRVQQAIVQFGALDILVNNAGVGEFGGRIHELDDATWMKVFDVNLTGVFRMTRARFGDVEASEGRIVNISSIASFIGIPILPAYAASKGGLDALTRAIAIDYAKEGIRCNVVNPGLTDTPMAAPLMSNPEKLDPSCPIILSVEPANRKR